MSIIKRSFRLLSARPRAVTATVPDASYNKESASSHDSIRVSLL